MSDSDLTTLLREHVCRYWGPASSDDESSCECGWWGEDWAAHVAAVLSGVYAITPLPGTPEFRRRVTPFADEQAWIYGIAPSEARFIIERGVDLARAQETPQ